MIKLINYFQYFFKAYLKMKKLLNSPGNSDVQMAFQKATFLLNGA
jgi:hypothetical protein